MALVQAASPNIGIHRRNFECGQHRPAGKDFLRNLTREPPSPNPWNDLFSENDQKFAIGGRR
jgi:hypothetical protein